MIAGQVHSEETDPRSGWEVSPEVGVRGAGGQVHLWWSSTPATQLGAGLEARTVLQWSSWAHVQELWVEELGWLRPDRPVSVPRTPAPRVNSVGDFWQHPQKNAQGRINGSMWEDNWQGPQGGWKDSALARLFVAHFGEAWSGKRDFMLVKCARSQSGCNLLRFLKTLGFHYTEPVFAQSPSGDSL